MVFLLKYFKLAERQQRSVLNFTFRDSVKDFVNVAYWLPPKDLIIVSSKFTIGDAGKFPNQLIFMNILFHYIVVALHYPIVKVKSDEKSNCYTPWTPL